MQPNTVIYGEVCFGPYVKLPICYIGHPYHIERMLSWIHMVATEYYTYNGQYASTKTD